MEQYKKDIISQNKEFQDIIYPLITNDTVQQMKNFKQHYETTCFEHCYTAAYHCYCICKKLNLDYKSATRAAMLHDLFLYDWRKRQPDRKGLHAFTHGKTACENASKLFDLNDKEKDIIEKHMWPVTVAFPKSIEGFILTFVNKYCALSESFEILKSRLFMKKAFRYAYLAFSLVIIKI
ncbi:MAG: HD domain-containing protein [Clostridia bacterium]